MRSLATRRIGTYSETVNFLASYGFFQNNKICEGCNYKYCFSLGHGIAFAGNSKADILRKINNEEQQRRIAGFVDER